MNNLLIADYQNATIGIGPLAEEWKDNPGKLARNLIGAMVKERQSIRDALGVCLWVVDQNTRMDPFQAIDQIGNILSAELIG